MKGTCRPSNASASRACVLRAGPCVVFASVLLSMVAGFCGEAFAGTATSEWWLRLRSTAYRFGTESAESVELGRLGAYQAFDGGIERFLRGRLSVRAAGRFADDLYLEGTVPKRSRLTSAYVLARPTSALGVRVGRQFVVSGSRGVTLDGASLEFNPRARWSGRVWGGAPAPADRAFEVTDLGEAADLGVQIGVRPVGGVHFAALHSYRERSGRIASRDLGAEASITPRKGLNAKGRALYDLEQDEWNRVEGLARWTSSARNLVLSTQVLDRRPSIDASSYFSRFESERVRLIRVGARHEHPGRLGAELDYTGTFVDTHTSARIGAALLAPFGRVGYSVGLGDAGDESRWFGDVAIRPWRWLRVEGGASIATYTLLEDTPDSEERDLVAAFARLRAEPRRGLDLRLEVQSVQNPFLSEDVRVLAGLDLLFASAGRGIGLRKGGWFQ